MPKLVTLTIDGLEVTVPEGTLIVDAAKKLGIDIPVFCYHPKMEPVGMCRMCLVDIGRPVIDRATGQPQLDENGKPKIQFAPKLDTACTTPVSPGMVVIQNSDKVKTARKDVVEFILTSHPLDCPICDKGGECPLQNTTISYSLGQGRFIYSDKKHFDKHVALGDLIWLDRERCIQCSRCVRFQSDIAGDAVIGFYQRGRSLEIITQSEPGFDSYFSGNTTDICPVGALTTGDFRFGARPWEMKPAASICSHCAVGCNLTYNVRREARSNGKMVIKRALPRQNEAVNELWLCDKGRFAYHFAENEQRLTQPLIRQGGELVPTTWEAALEKAAAGMKAAGSKLVTLVGGRLPNEDLFTVNKVTQNQGGSARLYSYMAGGDLVARVGVGQGTNLSSLGKNSVVLVVASNLEEEAPIWYLRLRQAARRGAVIIVVNPRPTKLDRAAGHVLRYSYGEEAAAIQALLPGQAAASSAAQAAAAQAFAAAENALIFYGSEGLDLAGSQSLAQACARLLQDTGHTGKANNGLVGVWPQANLQGAWDLGFRPSVSLAEEVAAAPAVWIAAADPAGDDPALAAALDQAGFVVVQELFLSATARLADVVLPAQASLEREGTYTSGERRVQRFYPVTPASPGVKADFSIAAELGGRLGLPLEAKVPALVFKALAAQAPDYAGLSYQSLSAVQEQWPVIGRQDLYYGGTTYENKQGLGVQLAPAAQAGESTPAASGPSAASSAPDTGSSLRAVPITRLYDRGVMTATSPLLTPRLAPAAIYLNSREAGRLGKTVQLSVNSREAQAAVVIDETIPDGVALVPRSVGLPLSGPVIILPARP